MAMQGAPSLRSPVPGSPRPAVPLPLAPPQQHALLPRARRSPLTRFACHPCRKKKTKCDGVRPTCGPCIKRDSIGSCEYPVREGAVSLVDDLKQTYAQMETENHALRELVDYLRLGPEINAWEALMRLRTLGDDPLQILQGIRGAESPLLPPPFPTAGGQEVNAVELDALASSVIRVPAKPWTSVAGDGIVSSLISAFFKWDDPFAYAYIDRELFLRDMRCGVPSQAKYCSPLLVNALCAMRSFGSDGAKQVKKATGIDLGAKFLAEAKRHLDAELLKVSLTTLQGLYTMFIYSCGDGTNRAGNMYRFSACEMLHRMKPGHIFAELDPGNPRESEQRRAVSRTAWGLFLFECLLSNTYQTLPMIPPPAIPKPQDRNDPFSRNIDINGHPFGFLSPEPPLVPGIFEVLCEAALLQYRVMVYNSEVRPGRTGGADDMDMRRELFSRVAALEDSLHVRMRYRENPTPQTLYLKNYINVVAYNILRPLPPATRIPYALHPSGYATARSLLIQLCAIDVHIMESYARRWGLVEYSPMFFAGIWNVTSTLIPMLDSSNPSSRTKSSSSWQTVPSQDEVHASEEAHHASDLFTRACALVSVLERDFPVVWLVMQGMLALAWTTGKVIPPEARQYFERSTQRRKELKDVPVSFALPMQEDVRTLLLEDDEEVTVTGSEGGKSSLGGDLAVLLERWGALSAS